MAGRPTTPPLPPAPPLAGDPPDGVPDVVWAPPTVRLWVPGAPHPLFYDWREAFPFLAAVLAAAPRIAAEAAAAAAAGPWPAWPETALYRGSGAGSSSGGGDAGGGGNTDGGGGAGGSGAGGGAAPAHPPATAGAGGDWRVLPLVYTFPADNPSATTWVPAGVRACPFTASVLARLPGLRTALFSRLGPATALAPHTGWAPLSNHVLRCHLALVVPPGEVTCGVVVGDEIRHHAPGRILVFDDAKPHSAFNHAGAADRVVLIFDLARPDTAPPGDATGGATAELEDFMAHFH
jgi:hypothetical protein